MSQTRITVGLPSRYVDDITALHADYYSRQWGFKDYFVQRVRTQMREFADRYDPVRDGIWSVLDDGAVMASITIDGATCNSGFAHLRWFIVAERLRGTGIGNLLMHAAVDFCHANAVDGIYLTTFEGLDPARHLYEKFGFTLTASERGVSWGTPVVEQRYECRLSDRERR